ncbi:MAG: FKBP-type peptidyl-prolyl cis-trans isomerase [bacterium]
MKAPHQDDVTKKSRFRFVPSFTAPEDTLENRLTLTTGVLHQPAQIMAMATRRAAPVTSLTVRAGTLGQPITFDVTVKGPASAGIAGGTVNLLSNGQLVQAIKLSSNGGRGAQAVGRGSFTYKPVPGGGAVFFGSHPVTAQFVNASGQVISSDSTTFNIREPRYRTLNTGVKYATIAKGSGPAAVAGQTASVLYTGFLASSGQIFDASLAHGTAPLSFKLGAGQLVPGFEAGVNGMRVGESRIVVIPPSQGYGSTPIGSIPANSTLIFVITLTGVN